MQKGDQPRSKSAAIRARLDHPIIDADGHTAEFEPVLFDYLRDIAGDSAVRRFKDVPTGPFSYRWTRMSWEQRRAEREPRPHWWVHPTKNTLDRATSSLPRLLYNRLDEMGIDFTVIYPSIGLFAIHQGDDELRRALCRAYNRMVSEVYGEYPDRMTPVAIIPMHTPAEAIDELDYAVGHLGLKAVVMAAHVRRPYAEVRESSPLARRAFWLDTLAVDSDYDYDPVWKRCVELRVCPSFHSPSAGIGFRTSISNFMFNHIGHFAASAEAICKALFFGGVTRRFPELRFSFLEGGASWACALLNDLVGHWEKRNLKALENVDPANLDHQLVRDLFVKYGERYGERRADPESERSALLWGDPEEHKSNLDEWRLAEVTRRDDFRDRFVSPFYFGCEGDDRLTALAFDRRLNPLRCALNALYSSDLGHFDLPDMRDAAAEAYELLEHELVAEEDFRAFVFGNAARFFTALNRDFFKGTRVEADVTKLLKDDR
jgi:predicted TIM-barrel fold metal-dependent hydrolase